MTVHFGLNDRLMRKKDGHPRTKGKPRGFRRDRDCGTCKRRGVKCDLNRPSCDICKREGVRCDGYATLVKWMNSSSTGTPQPTKQTSPPAIESSRSSQQAVENSVAPVETEATSPDGSNWTVDMSSYLTYFMTKLNDARVQYGSSMTLAASMEDADLSDVWTLVWKHIEWTLSPNHYADTDHHFLQINALNALGRMVSSGNILAIFGITTLAYLDVKEGPFGDWKRHLIGARAVLDYHCPDRSQFDRLADRVPGLQQALSLLNWYDVMGAVVHQDRPLIFNDWHRELMENALFDLVGCARDTFALYVRIAEQSLDANRSNALHEGILHLLKVDSHYQNDDIALNDAWRLGAILATLATLEPDSQAIAFVTERICRLLVNVPQDDGLYLHFASVVFLTGIHVSSDWQEEAIRSYWSYCNSRAIPMYPLAQELCNERRRQAGRPML